MLRDNQALHLAGSLADLDGFDVDWEPDLSDNGTPEQFHLLFTAIRAAFASQDRYYYLTFSPNEIGTLDVPTLNSAFDLVSLQLYGGADAQMFIQAGVSPSLLACGIKFEPSGGVIYEDAQQAYSLYLAESYNGITIWRLSSTDFQYEQAQQMLLYQLVYGLPFDDTLIIGAAGNPPISQLAIRSGDVLDAIQVTNSGIFGKNSLQYVLQKHGGDGGDASTLTIADGDAVVEVSGYTGIWSDVSCVAQLTITTLQGEVFGPFGSTEHASALTPFQLKAPEGEAIAAFRGAIVQAEVTGGSKTYVVGNLSASYASLTTP